MDLFPQFVREFGDRYRRRRFILPNLHLGAAAGATAVGSGLVSQDRVADKLNLFWKSATCLTCLPK